MAGLIVQHNLNAINANNKLSMNVIGTKKATEKLSSGYQINRAGDNASGLAVSEKMRSQIRGLGQAIRNANDGISLIQTAEGGLNETHAILQRMRELAVQSANGTYQDELDREAMQLEVDALKSEIDRIAASTEYNKIKLLDGSLGGASSTAGKYGPRYASLETTTGSNWQGTVVTSSIVGVTVGFTTGASAKGGENASWDIAGTTLTINLSAGATYTQAQIDDLIKGATQHKASGQTGAIPTVTVKLGTGVIIGEQKTLGITTAGVRAKSEIDGVGGDLTAYLISNTTSSTDGYANFIQFTSNNYGLDTRNFTLATDVSPGKEWVEIDTVENNPNVKDGAFILHLSTGKEYTQQDLENILRKAGLDYEVTLADATGVIANGDIKFYANTSVTAGSANALTLSMGTGVAGQGVGKDKSGGVGEGLTFQIGANGVADQRVSLSVDDMSSGALGIKNADISTREAANYAIEIIDKAISTVSFQRAGLGALQNRLEYTVNNLTVTQENLTAAESQIRDTDMASEMINYTKFSILQQAAQAMLAQANQAPQAILQLLG